MALVKDYLDITKKYKALYGDVTSLLYSSLYYFIIIN